VLTTCCTRKRRTPSCTARSAASSSSCIRLYLVGSVGPAGYGNGCSASGCDGPRQRTPIVDSIVQASKLVSVPSGKSWVCQTRHDARRAQQFKPSLRVQAVRPTEQLSNDQTRQLVNLDVNVPWTTRGDLRSVGVERFELPTGEHAVAG
jgi:hypothetical protein